MLVRKAVTSRFKLKLRMAASRKLYNGLKLCNNYGSARGCKYGDQCRFSHDHPESVPICTFYASAPSECKYDQNCGYRHLDVVKITLPDRPIWNPADDPDFIGMVYELRDGTQVIEKRGTETIVIEPMDSDKMIGVGRNDDYRNINKRKRDKMMDVGRYNKRNYVEDKMDVKDNKDRMVNVKNNKGYNDKLVDDKRNYVENKMDVKDKKGYNDKLVNVGRYNKRNYVEDKMNDNNKLSDKFDVERYKKMKEKVMRCDAGWGNKS